MEQLRIVAAFLQRDFFIYGRRMPRYVFYYSLWFPTMYATCFGYLLPKIGMGAQAASATNVILVGTILFAMLTLSFALNADFLFDFDRERFIDYQLILLNPRLIILEKILFYTMILFCSMIPFFPFLKLLFHSSFDVSNASWIKTALMLLSASLYCSCLQVLFACVAKSTRSTRHFWRRINYPLVMMGGFLVPWHVMHHFSAWLGYLTLLNPLLYVTEGLRGAMLGSGQYIPFPICFSVLLAYSAVFIVGSWYFFRKKVDHI